MMQIDSPKRVNKHRKRRAKKAAAIRRKWLRLTSDYITKTPTLKAIQKVGIHYSDEEKVFLFYTLHTLDILWNTHSLTHIFPQGCRHP